MIKKGDIQLCVRSCGNVWSWDHIIGGRSSVPLSISVDHAMATSFLPALLRNILNARPSGALRTDSMSRAA
jgi:hypothetical protein